MPTTPAGTDIVPNARQWSRRNGSIYLFKVQSLAKEFQRRYLNKLEKTYRKNSLSFNGRAEKYRDEKQFQQLLTVLWDKQWITYAKQPFGGPEQVLEYLGWYRHRVAVTNNRIIALDNGSVRFRYCDRSDNNTEKQLTISVQEMMLRLIGIDIFCCPQCGKGKMVYLMPITESAYEDTS